MTDFQRGVRAALEAAAAAVRKISEQYEAEATQETRDSQMLDTAEFASYGAAAAWAAIRSIDPATIKGDDGNG